MNQLTILQEGTYAFQLFLAVVVGFLLGYTRQKEHKHAGIRTYSLVCMGATLVTIISKDFFMLVSVPGATVIPSQLAASIMTSIGFLGAGVIFRQQDHISGITTASGLWVTAAIGIAIGFGFYILASIATIFSYLLIAIFWRVSVKIEEMYPKVEQPVAVEPSIPLQARSRSKSPEKK
jgi:putative Mg2+ transporter-C (MgtC) family protein